MDFMKQEQERGITIASAAISCKWRDHHINLNRYTGHVDFMVEVERSLRVLDGVIAIFCAVSGVEAAVGDGLEPGPEIQCSRIAFINKMDTAGADFDRCVETMNERLDAKPCKIPASSCKE